jgi:hypothetical protein
MKELKMEKHIRQDNPRVGQNKHPIGRHGQIFYDLLEYPGRITAVR